MKLRLIKVFFLSLFVTLEIVTQLIAREAGWGSPNHGFSFGLAQGLLPGMVYLVLAGGLFVWIAKNEKVEIGWWLVLAGGLANAVSRLIMGAVWDYLHWGIGFSLWFNSSDVLIVIGSLMVIVKEFKNGHGKS